MSSIEFRDPQVHADFKTFIGRARQASVDGSVRIQTLGPMLVLTIAVFQPTGALGEGAVLGMRIMPVLGGDPVDTIAPIAAVSDRLARAKGVMTTFQVPPTTLNPAWSGVAPPRGGWELVGEVSSSDLDEAARAGIEAVTKGIPEPVGVLAVEGLRRRVWDESTTTVPPVRSGMAFAAHVLGFTHTGELATVAMHGAWTRLSTTRGHVLSR